MVGFIVQPVDGIVGDPDEPPRAGLLVVVECAAGQGIVGDLLVGAQPAGDARASARRSSACATAPARRPGRAPLCVGGSGGVRRMSQPWLVLRMSVIHSGVTRRGSSSVTVSQGAGTPARGAASSDIGGGQSAGDEVDELFGADLPVGVGEH